MISAFNVLGWMIIGGTAVWIICTQKKNGAPAPGNDDVCKNLPARDLGYASSSWCEAIEALTSHASLIFDSSLKVISAGKTANSLLGCGKTAVSGHIMDIFPPDVAPQFLEGVVAARRTGFAKWVSEFGGAKVSVHAALKDGDVVVTIGGLP